MKITAEAKEVAALRFVCNGNGSWPVPMGHLFHGIYDEVVVAIPLEDLTEIHVFLRNNFKTAKHYKFRVTREEVS